MIYESIIGNYIAMISFSRFDYRLLHHICQILLVLCCLSST